MRIELLVPALLLFLSPAIAWAQNPCAIPHESKPEQYLARSDAGLSGTGLSGDDESGIGGTGYSGGDESGIGGTGVFGTITGFGSICVNGLRIRYDEATPVLVDGRESTSAALAIGQVVAVHAVGQGAVLDATSLSSHSALTVPVTSIDYVQKRLSVMGQRVMAPDDFSQASHGLVLGSRITVSGLRQSDGSVVATRIVLAPKYWPDSVSGITKTSAHGDLEVGGIRLPRHHQDPADGSRAAIQAGQFIRITGGWNRESSSLIVSAVSTTPLLAPGLERLSIEGYATRRPGSSALWMHGIELDRPSFERASKKADRGQRLRVSGYRNPQGRLRVEGLQVVDRPQPQRNMDRPRPTKHRERPKPTEYPEVPPSIKPKPSERPPIIERPDIDLAPILDDMIQRFEKIEIDRTTP